ncbi:hypothetical protein GcM3_095017 [Golovinomyces cichoracearum]|uniref:Transmembrane protein 135 N-terminal domain-containing protein n=1 Tax=Golovinomyces cichoracearum TaxID=62708 RepID=A0A420IES9_9PEZI|nr:hypothetical protein GcM3_095017 [Golovinomyces cichoracearum]
MTAEVEKPNEKRSPLAKVSAKSTADPILRNALRYTISSKEYEALHKYVLSRSRTVRRRVPPVNVFEQLVGSTRPEGGNDRLHGQPTGDKEVSWLVYRDDNNAAMIRESLRVFVGATLGLKLWSILRRIIAPAEKTRRSTKTSLWKCSNLRQSFSLGLILLLHRLLFRFFIRLRTHLLAPAAAPFRKRNINTFKVLTSSYAPAIGASFAGLALGIYPAVLSRITIALYVLSRGVEFAYNLAEEEGWIWKNGKPSWWGSWLSFPVASGQLLLAFVYDRDCFPKAYGDFILKNSPSYIQTRPDDYPDFLPWPSKYEIVDSLGTMGKQNYPNLISPILFPETKPNIPSIAPITNNAHPLITHLSCATLHPSDPSCLRTYLNYWITVLPKLARFFSIIFSILSLPRLLIHINDSDSLINAPQVVIGRLINRVIRYSIFVSGAIGTSWASVCLFQSLLSRKRLSEKRFFLGGFLGGLWAWIVRRQAHSEFSYSMRASILSFWQIGQKKNWWKGFPGGEVLIFTFGLAIVNVVYELDKGRGVVNSSAVRSMLNGARGYGWKSSTPVLVVEQKNDDKK